MKNFIFGAGIALVLASNEMMNVDELGMGIFLLIIRTAILVKDKIIDRGTSVRPDKEDADD